MHVEDARQIIVQALREWEPYHRSKYGYEVHVPTIIRHYLATHGGGDPEDHQVQRASPPFMEAAWNLCRQGVLRPGISSYGGQATDHGSAGCGFSLTTFGRSWLKEFAEETLVPSDPGRFSEIVADYIQPFGPGFRERAQEAVRCYNSGAYVACCAMCGAAVESILLASAIAKRHGDEAGVLKAYKRAGGRRAVENMVIGTAKQTVKDDFTRLTDLLKYWRDAAAHGTATRLGSNEAYVSLLMLIRCAAFVHDHWDELTGDA